MALVKKLFLWVCFGAGFSVVCLAGRPIVGETYWTSAIDHGELVLVAATLTASAVGYAAMAKVTGGAEWAKYFVIGPGVLVLVLAILVYSSFSHPSAPRSVDSVARQSYVFLAASLVLGALSTFVTHRAE